MKQERRFTIGENVMVRRDDPSPFAGLPAVIEGIQPHDRGVALLDRYIVVFTWGEKQTFYDAQLEPTRDDLRLAPEARVKHRQ